MATIYIDNNIRYQYNTNTIPIPIQWSHYNDHTTTITIQYKLLMLTRILLPAAAAAGCVFALHGTWVRVHIAPKQTCSCLCSIVGEGSLTTNDSARDMYGVCTLGNICQWCTTDARRVCFKGFHGIIQVGTLQTGSAHQLILLDCTTRLAGCIAIKSRTLDGNTRTTTTH